MEKAGKCPYHVAHNYVNQLRKKLGIPRDRQLKKAIDWVSDDENWKEMEISPELSVRILVPALIGYLLPNFYEFIKHVGSEMPDHLYPPRSDVKNDIDHLQSNIGRAIGYWINLWQQSTQQGVNQLSPADQRRWLFLEKHAESYLHSLDRGHGYHPEAELEEYENPFAMLFWKGVRSSAQRLLDKIKPILIQEDTTGSIAGVVEEEEALTGSFTPFVQIEALINKTLEDEELDQHMKPKSFWLAAIEFAHRILKIAAPRGPVAPGDIGCPVFLIPSTGENHNILGDIHHGLILPAVKHYLQSEGASD